MREKSRQIALSAMSAALAAVFLTIGKFVPVFELTAYMLAEIAMMIPLTKKYYAGGFLSFLAAAGLTLLLAGGDFIYVMPFAVFFGLHPLANAVIEKFKIKNWLGFALKALWFCGALFLMYLLTDLFIADQNLITKFIDEYFFIAIPVAGTVFFVFYDWFIMRAFKTLKLFTDKLNF